jgi:hypothetical protein
MSKSSYHKTKNEYEERLFSISSKSCSKAGDRERHLVKHIQDFFDIVRGQGYTESIYYVSDKGTEGAKMSVLSYICPKLVQHTTYNK